jgi:hypothetical protein
MKQASRKMVRTAPAQRAREAGVRAAFRFAWRALPRAYYSRFLLLAGVSPSVAPWLFVAQILKHGDVHS